MTETTTIRVSGTEVFNGNALTMRVQKKVYEYKAMGAIPPLPAAWRLGEINSVGYESPTITIDAIYDASVPHASGEANSVVDWQFLNEFVASSGPKYFKDDQIKPPTGSEMLVYVKSFNLTFDSKTTEAPNIGANVQPYRIMLGIASGTPWWSGTGILQK